jgi:hypothetical protein
MGLKKIEAVKAGKRTLLKVSSLKAHAASLPVANIKPPTPKKRSVARKAVAKKTNSRATRQREESAA